MDINQNHLKLDSILKVRAPVILRRIFMERWKAIHGEEWVNSIENGSKFITGIGKRLYNSSKRLQKLSLESGDIDKWDLTLLATVLPTIKPQKDHQKNDRTTEEQENIETKKKISIENKSIEKLLTIRNQCVHSPTMSLINEEFNKLWDEIKLILLSLGDSEEELDLLKRKPINLTAERLREQWSVPPKNSNFIGRSELLKQIEDYLSEKTTPAVLTACRGLGGIGKTQVALEFVWQQYKKYNGVVWFNAESRDRLQNDYISLGRELNIIGDDDNINAEERARYVKHWLEDSSRAGWLLVYDNADNYKTIRELLPTKGGKILITSRHTANWPKEISIDVFTIEESRAYIQKVLGNPIS